MQYPQPREYVVPARGVGGAGGPDAAGDQSASCVSIRGGAVRRGNANQTTAPSRVATATPISSTASTWAASSELTPMICAGPLARAGPTAKAVAALTVSP